MDHKLRDQSGGIEPSSKKKKALTPSPSPKEGEGSKTRGWHHGVIGIVASRLVERYGAPVFIGSYEDAHDDSEEAATVRFSVRGIPEFHVFEAIEYEPVKSIRLKGGGHKAAGGFTMPAANLEKLRQGLREFADRENILPSHIMPLVNIDVRVDLSDISMTLLQECDRLQPCGLGNADPVFYSENVRVISQQARGKDKVKHLSLELDTGNGKIKAIAWRWGEYCPVPNYIDIAYKLRANQWQDTTSVELEVIGIRAASTSQITENAPTSNEPAPVITKSPTPTIVTNHREILLQSIATTIDDYRQGEIPTINPSHVDRWIAQFDRFGCDDNAQIVILEQMDRILKNYYISRTKAQTFIHRALISKKLLGANPAKTLPNIKFLQIQTKGSSQNDLLNLCDSFLQRLYGIGIRDCGESPIAYIYFDDCLYSGNTLRRDIISWLPTAIHGTTLHIIFFGCCTEGYKYSKRKIEQQAQLRSISVHFWKWHEFHNSRWLSSRFDCFWSHEIVGEQLVDQYVDTVNKQRLQKPDQSFPPLFRPNNMPNQDSIFSSPAAREIIEYAFLKAGAYIVSLPKSPNTNMRPLGYDYFESLGFGAILVTYRNIANNCPLALWWGDPNKPYPLNDWYPLFPRTVNIKPITALEEF